MQQVSASGITPLETPPAALLMGYGVYTSFCWPLTPHWFGEHYKRLTHDAAALGIPLEFGEKELFKLLQKHCDTESAWRLTLVPEHTGEAFTGEKISGSVLLLTQREKKTDTATPLNLKTVQAERPLAGIKHLSIAPALVAKRRAREKGFDDVAWLNQDRTFAEASTSNIFFIRDNLLFTPDPETHHCLPGITRARIIEAIGALGLALSDEAPSLPLLHSFDGGFLTNAIRGTHKIASIDGMAFPWPTHAVELLQKITNAVNA